jgi:hypothetical protein
MVNATATERRSFMSKQVLRIGLGLLFVIGQTSLGS